MDNASTIDAKILLFLRIRVEASPWKHRMLGSRVKLRMAVEVLVRGPYEQKPRRFARWGKRSADDELTGPRMDHEVLQGDIDAARS